MKNRVPVNPGRVLITPEDGSAAFYATMTRADNPTQEGDPLNKSTLLKDATAALFCLSSDAVPDDVLTYLGNYNKYWWKRRAHTPAHASETAFSNKFFPCTTSSSNYVNIYYGDEYSVSFDGTVALNSDGYIRVYPSAASTIQSTIAGKYFYTSTNPTSIFYCDPSATVTYTTNSSYTNSYGFTISTGKTVTGHEDYFGTTYEFLSSTDRNAYQDSGSLNGYEYTYIGIPFKNAISAPHIATGIYFGTGTFGEENKNVLTLDFAPDVIFIRNSDINGNSSAVRNQFIMLVKEAPILTGDNYSASATVNGTAYLNTEWNGNVTSWYVSNDNVNTTIYYGAMQQYNVANERYFYFAVGFGGITT